MALLPWIIERTLVCYCRKLIESHRLVSYEYNLLGILAYDANRTLAKTI